jgi:hypothetical protein
MYMNTWFLNKMISLKFSADGTNGIFRDCQKKFGMGQTGSGQFRIFRDGTFGIRDTKKSVPQDSSKMTTPTFTFHL